MKKREKFHPFEPYYLTGEVPKKLNSVLSNMAEIRILFPVGE